VSPRPRSYATPAALRRALEDRLRARSQERGEDLARLRRLVAFDRLLARLFADEEGAPWIVKGGFGLEVRYRMEARATKDLDLSLADARALAPGAAALEARLLEALQDAAERDIGDPFIVVIGQPRQQFDAPPEGGARFPVEVRLDGRVFATFHLDVGVGDVLVDPPEWLRGEEFLGFAGISAIQMAVLPIPQQFAEKAHVYTLPRSGPANTRVKDLVDLALMLERETPDPQRTRVAIEATFARRRTHPIPAMLPPPPPSWEDAFLRLAREAALRARSADEAHRRIAAFWHTFDFPSGSEEA
jgi:hypothetical protein